ncbi:hypothetical protein ACIBF1_23080 [Spirillospora sp. NPDC050679]
MTLREEPLRPGDPGQAGPFRLRARLADHTAGAVFAGAGPHGEPAAIAVLHPAAAEDPAVRERLAAACGALPGVLDAAPHGPVAWAAVPHEPGAPVDAALGLLDDAALTAAPEPSGEGPAFAPHWTVQPAPVWTAPPSQSDWPPEPPRPTGLATALGLGALVLASALIALLVLWPDSEERTPISLPAPTAHDLPPDMETPTRRPSPSPEDGPPGPVAGPTYGKGEETYHMKLDGLPFEFDAPGDWGCLRGDKKPFDSRWICMDEGGAFPPRSSGAGGMVAVQKCPAPCGEGERKALRKNIVVDEEDWRRTDSTTMYAEVQGRDEDDERVVRVAMSHVFAARKGGALDTAVAVQLTGPPEQKKPMQKLINEIRKRTS